MAEATGPATVSVSESPASAPKPRRRKWPFRVLWALAGFILCGCLYWLWCVHAAMAERDALIAELRAKGEPVWWDEVVDKALAEQPPNSGVELFRQAIAILQGQNPAKKVIPSTLLGTERRKHFPEPKAIPEAKEELRLAAPAFALAEDAARRKPGIVTQNLRSYSGITTPMIWRQLAVPQSLHLMLDLDAFDALARGDPRRAYRAALLSLKSTEQLAAEPLAYSQALRHGSMFIARRSLLDCLAYSSPTDDEFIELDRLLAAKADRSNFEQALVAERAYILRVLENEEEIGLLLASAAMGGQTRSERMMLDLWGKILASPLGAPIRLRTESEVIRLFEKLRPLVDQPGLEQQALNDLYKEFERRSPLHRSIDEPLHLVSWWGQSLHTGARRSHQQSVFTHLALRLRRYHDKHGRFPNRLDELCDALMPRIPLDWFGGQPIVYKPSATGFRLELPKAIVPKWEHDLLKQTPIRPEYGLDFKLKELPSGPAQR